MTQKLITTEGVLKVFLTFSKSLTDQLYVGFLKISPHKSYRKKVFTHTVNLLLSSQSDNRVPFYRAQPFIDTCAILPFQLFNIYPMIVIGTKGGITLGALSLAGFVARLQALQAEHMETFGEHCIFLLHLT